LATLDSPPTKGPWGFLPLPLTTKAPIKIGVSEPQGLEVRNCVIFLTGNVKLSLKQNLIFKKKNILQELIATSHFPIKSTSLKVVLSLSIRECYIATVEPHSCCFVPCLVSCRLHTVHILMVYAEEKVDMFCNSL
jgi:hypothetical protein